MTAETLENGRPLTRSTQRPAAGFNEYVLAYSRRQSWNIFLMFAGVTLAIGAGIYLDGALCVIGAAIGLGMTGAGGGGLVMGAGAHAAYTRHLGLSTTNTYSDAPPAPTVRAFVPSTNPTTIRAGRFTLPAATWAALFNSAAGNDGRLTRDAATKVLPRAMYRDWQATLGELARLGLFDDDGRVTAAGLEFARGNLSPYPNRAYAPSGAPSTPARRPHGAHGGQVAP